MPDFFQIFKKKFPTEIGPRPNYSMTFADEENVSNTFKLLDYAIRFYSRGKIIPNESSAEDVAKYLNDAFDKIFSGEYRELFLDLQNFFSANSPSFKVKINTFLLEQDKNYADFFEFGRIRIQQFGNAIITRQHGTTTNDIDLNKLVVKFRNILLFQSFCQQYFPVYKLTIQQIVFDALVIYQKHHVDKDNVFKRLDFAIRLHARGTIKPEDSNDIEIETYLWESVAKIFASEPSFSIFFAQERDISTFLCKIDTQYAILSELPPDGRASLNPRSLLREMLEKLKINPPSTPDENITNFELLGKFRNILLFESFCLKYFPRYTHKVLELVEQRMFEQKIFEDLNKDIEELNKIQARGLNPEIIRRPPDKPRKVVHGLNPEIPRIPPDLLSKFYPFDPDIPKYLEIIAPYILEQPQFQGFFKNCKYEYMSYGEKRRALGSDAFLCGMNKKYAALYKLVQETEAQVEPHTTRVVSARHALGSSRESEDPNHYELWHKSSNSELLKLFKNILLFNSFCRNHFHWYRETILALVDERLAASQHSRSSHS